MPSSTQFIVALIGLLLVWGGIALAGYPNPIQYFKTDTGKGILKGIVLAVAFAVALTLAGCSGGTYFNDASVYAGLDHTTKRRPQGEDSGPDRRSTSNSVIRGNLYESEDGRFRTNAKYTHHSCAFSPDDASYDAVGVELEYKFYER